MAFPLVSPSHPSVLPHNETRRIAVEFSEDSSPLPPKRIATLFPSRILRFLRFLLFQDKANNTHPLFAKADRLSGEVIGAGIEVHRIMAPGW